MFVHYAEPVDITDSGYKYRVMLHESQWERLEMPGNQASREYMMMMLADIKHVLIKAAHSERTTSAG